MGESGVAAATENSENLKAGADRGGVKTLTMAPSTDSAQESETPGLETKDKVSDDSVKAHHLEGVSVEVPPSPSPMTSSTNRRASRKPLKRKLPPTSVSHSYAQPDQERFNTNSSSFGVGQDDDSVSRTKDEDSHGIAKSSSHHGLDGSSSFDDSFASYGEGVRHSFEDSYGGGDENSYTLEGQGQVYEKTPRQMYDGENSASLNSDGEGDAERNMTGGEMDRRSFRIEEGSEQCQSSFRVEIDSEPCDSNVKEEDGEMHDVSPVAIPKTVVVRSLMGARETPSKTKASKDSKPEHDGSSSDNSHARSSRQAKSNARTKISAGIIQEKMDLINTASFNRAKTAVKYPGIMQAKSMAKKIIAATSHLNTAVKFPGIIQARGGSKTAGTPPAKTATKTPDTTQEWSAVGEDKFRCEKCGKMFACKEDVVRHLHAVHSLKDFTRVNPKEVSPCSVCGKIFATKSALNTHVAIHNKESAAELKKVSNTVTIPATHNETLKCNNCRKLFKTDESFHSHCCKRALARAYGCGMCGKTYTDLYILTNHLALHRAGVAPDLECHQCGHKFMYSMELRRHSAVHQPSEPVKKTPSSLVAPSTMTSTVLNPDKPGIKLKISLSKKAEAKAKGDVYDKRDREAVKGALAGLGTEGALAGLAPGRKRTPGGKRVKERKHACEHCGKMFPDLSHLDLHMNVHREKQFMCNVCSKRFSFRRSLDIHMLTHTNTRPHKCQFCGKVSFMLLLLLLFLLFLFLFLLKAVCVSLRFLFIYFFLNQVSIMRMC
jgi:uncharacterized C2H2 Zn-finger protein